MIGLAAIKTLQTNKQTKKQTKNTSLPELDKNVCMRVVVERWGGHAALDYVACTNKGHNNRDQNP